MVSNKGQLHALFVLHDANSVLVAMPTKRRLLLFNSKT